MEKDRLSPVCRHQLSALYDCQSGWCQRDHSCREQGWRAKCTSWPRLAMEKGTWLCIRTWPAVLFLAVKGFPTANDSVKPQGVALGGLAHVNVSIRFMIDDVSTAIKFYTTHLGLSLDHDASPAFASVTRDGVRLLLSGKTNSGRRAMPDGREPIPGGWNRVHIQVDDLDLEAEVKRLREAGLKFRNEILIGPGGSQILLDDPSGNPVELFQPQ